MRNPSNHSLIAIVVFGFTFLMLTVTLPKTGSMHEPITTKVMFNKEIIRILERNCLACHAPGKIKSDISLTTYEEARPWAKAIKEEVLEKRMMPFQTVKGYGAFVHDYILPQRDVELLVSWIEGGAPRGEAKDYPKEEIDKLIAGKEWNLGKPDLILTPDKETRISADGSDETRCFSLPTNLKEDRWVNGLDFQPGAGAVVNSANMFLAPIGTSGNGPTAGRGRRGDSIPTKAGVKSNCGSNAQALAQWSPGQLANRLPGGGAIKLPANSRILLQINYRKNGAAVADRSSVGLYFTKGAASKQIRKVTISAPATVIPPNAEGLRVRASYSINEQTDVIAIRPLLFPFAKSIEAAAYLPDGSVEPLVWAKDYRFDWQPAYFFKKPVALPKGARIEVTAYLNNSDNNRNNPNDPPSQVNFADALLEITLTSTPPIKTATLNQSRR